MHRFLPVLLLAFWPGSSAPSLHFPQQSRTPLNAPPVELRISGPGVIRVGQEVRFKVLLTNHSSHPIVVADRSAGKMWSNFAWTVVDKNGDAVPTAPVKPGQILVDDIAGVLFDRELHVLEPEARLLYRLADDPTVSSCYPSGEKMKCLEKRIFPGKGTYRVRLHYRFSPKGEWDYKDLPTGRLTLSPGNVEVLKMTPPVDITSNEWIVHLE